MNRLTIATFGTLVGLFALGFSDTASGQTLSLMPTSMSFQVQSGGVTSAPQALSITPSNGATTVLVDMTNGPNWLTVNGVTVGNKSTFNVVNTQSVNLTANTGGYASGSVLNGSFIIGINNVPASYITYNVALTVGTPTILSANPATLSFSGIAVRIPALLSASRS